jgi:hypothetical protein
MRDRARQRAMAEAKSHRASPEELREASKRLKEIEDELSQRDLLPETKQGEERERRYARLLRIRSLRDEFQSERPLEELNASRSLLLAIVMTVASFLLCAGCAGGAFFALQLANQKPDPTVTTANFWDNMEHQQYAQIHNSELSPTLRVRNDESTFVSQANQADKDYGQVASAVATGQAGDMTKTAQLTYAVTRGNHTYNVTLTLSTHSGTWGIDDLGAAIDPSSAGVPSPTPTLTPSESPTTTPTTTTSPTGDIDTRRNVA